MNRPGIASKGFGAQSVRGDENFWDQRRAVLGVVPRLIDRYRADVKPSERTKPTFIVKTRLSRISRSRIYS